MIIKVMSYNVHSCLSLTKENTLAKIAGLIEQHKPSIVGLNEVEKFTPRTKFANQPKRLAASRQMDFVFGPAIKLGPIGFFGNVLMSRFPIMQWQNMRLHSKRELRACVKATLKTPNGLLAVYVTHLGLNRVERRRQLDTILHHIRAEKGPTLLMGDFNAFEEELVPLRSLFTDACADAGYTYATDNPKARIDYIFTSAHITVHDARVIDFDASDHFPVLATLEI